MIEVVDKNCDQLQFMDAICDLLYPLYLQNPSYFLITAILYIACLNYNEKNMCAYSYKISE